MKVVINRCYGGFSLSNKAIKLYGAKKDFDVHFYKQTKYSYKDNIIEFKHIKKEDAEILVFPVKEYLGEIIDNIPSDKYLLSWRIERTDPDLISVIEELGNLANGDCAKLEIVEIPDGINWEISEYDGIERIEEIHRSWY